jgi:hypothetical protein
MSKPKNSEEFDKFRELTKNLINVSNSEVRRIMDEEKRAKKSKKVKSKGK